MSAAKTFISNNPEYFRQEIPVKEDWLRVKSQAIEHTRYLEKSALLNVNRPREDDDIKEYRNQIIRRYTKASVDKFRTKTSRIIRTSGLSINEESLSSSLKEYFDSMPYRYLSRPANLTTYIFNEVYSRAIEDANAVEILLPYNPDNPTVAPILDPKDGGIEKNRTLGIKPMIIPCEDIVYFDDNVFSWHGGLMRIPGESDARQPEPWFWLLDNEWFYQYVPVRVDQHRVVYEAKRWYFHDTGIGDDKVMPVNVLPADIVYSENGNVPYQVSLLSSAFEYYDEAMTRASDAQAVWYTTAFPVHVMEETDCTAQGCFNGWVPNPNPNAKDKKITCSACGGSGKMARPSPYGVIIKKKTPDGESTTGKAYEMISPDTSILELTYKIPFDIMQKGDRQIGLDVLENKVESGVSREMRFEDVKDKLADIADKFAIFMQTHSFYAECLLNERRQDRVVPKVNTPTDFHFKTSYDLKEDAEKALPVDRLQKTLAYLRNIYKDNARLLKVYEVAHRYSPILVNDWQEVKDWFNMGIIGENDIAKRNYAVHVFKEISKLAGWDEMTDETAFALADKMMEERGLFRPERLPLVNENGET